MRYKSFTLICLISIGLCYAHIYEFLPSELVGHYDSKEPIIKRIGYFLNPNRTYTGRYELDLYKDSTFDYTSCGVSERKWCIVSDTLILTGIYPDSVKAAIAENFPDTDTSTLHFKRKFIIEKKNGNFSLEMCGQASQRGRKFKKWCLILSKRD
ncbi:MAG TPA: hypothetical protein DIW47_11530 [Bacteroidetes bacterium]|nr:hypothetical protein [Bacteroidota bacterium]